jgi:ubiquinone/menaquinone biosynthesis C-methylase UbiE
VDVDQEIERIRKQYVFYDHDPETRARWSAFAADEVAHRNQQYVALATLLWSLGKLTLSGLKILDVGCGQGRMLRACLDMGSSPENLTGVDLQPSRIEEARRLSPQLDFRLGNGTDLEFPDRQFDLVMQFVVFSSIFSPALRRRLASEMARVLKPGGYIFWWDCVKTVEGKNAQELVPQELFPDLPAKVLPFALRPKPSSCLRQRRLFRLLGRVVDRFGYPTSHYAALLGPKLNDCG